MNFVELKERSKKIYNQDYWQFILVYVIFTSITYIALSSYIIPLLLIGGPLTFGFITYNINNVRGTKCSLSNLTEGISRFSDLFLVYLLKTGLVLLWSLLFIVPGVIKWISYSQTFFIMHDNTNLTPKEALDFSEKMMVGHKKEFFLLNLSFIGWHLLGILTLGILEVFYVGPYYKTTMSLYYEELKLK